MLPTTPRTSLNVHLAWPETGYRLGLAVPDPALPARLPCPLCPAGRLTVCEDGRDGGAWFACRDCGRAGDLIELAAALWGLSVPAAVSQLVRHGAAIPAEAVTPEAVAGYVRDYPASRQRFQVLWQRARAYLEQVRSPALAAVRTRLHLHSPLTGPGWRRGPGRLLGGLPKEEVEAAFCPASTGQGGAGDPGRYRLNPSAGRVLSGPGWGDVLAVPYADLPGRICAWEFLGRRGTAADRVFRPLRQLARSGSNQYAPQPPRSAEAGLAGLDTVEAADAGWGGAAFAVGDVALALRLQVRHFQVSLRPLPLVSWYDGPRARTQLAWRVLAGRPVIFWGRDLGPALLWQAGQAEGLLVVAGPEERTAAAWDAYLRRDEPWHLLRRLRRRAVPWREFLRRWAEEQPDGAVRELGLGLEGYPLDLRRLAQECGGGRLAELLPPAPRPRTIRLGSRTVVERDDGWYVARRGRPEEVLLNAVLRIDAITPVAGDLEYRGRVLFRGEEVPFVVAAAEWERQPARWLRTYLLRQGKGVLHFAPGVRGLVEIALRFHEPAVG